VAFLFPTRHSVPAKRQVSGHEFTRAVDAF
jgi:hypothetical protein